MSHSQRALMALATLRTHASAITERGEYAGYIHERPHLRLYVVRGDRLHYTTRGDDVATLRRRFEEYVADPSGTTKRLLRTVARRE